MKMGNFFNNSFMFVEILKQVQHDENG